MSNGPSHLGMEALISAQLQSAFLVKIMDYIEKINFSFDDDPTTFLHKFVSLMLILGLVMLVKHISSNFNCSQKMFAYLYFPIVYIFKTIFYKKYTLVLNNSYKYANIKYKNKLLRDYVLHRALQDKIFMNEDLNFMDKSKYYDTNDEPIVTTKYHSGFNIYYYATPGRKFSNIEVNYEFICIFHTNIINDCLEHAYNYEMDSGVSDTDANKIKIANYNEHYGVFSYCNVNPDKVYENNNLKKVGMIISTHVENTRKFNLYHPLILLIDGEAGLGKTKIADYVVINKMTDNMYLYDMTNFRTIDISKIFSQIKNDTRSNKGTSVVMIDEIDKYLDYYIKDTYEKKKDEQIEKMILFSKNNPGMKVENLIKSFEDYDIMTKQYFLYELLNLIDARENGSRKIFIFCSNNFMSIFSNIDMKHFNSLYDRLIKLKFNKCDKHELEKICNYYDDSKREKEIKKVISKLDNNFEITIRKFHHSFIHSGYDVIATLNELVKYQ